MLGTLLSAISLFSLSLAGPNPPPGALVVGQGGQYSTIQQAVNAAGPGRTIFIQPGTYREQVFIPPNQNDITIIGASSTPDSYYGNRVTITNNLAQDRGLNNDNTATLRAHGNNLKVYNVNLVNTRGKGSQALALSAYGDRQGYYGCQFRGFQDTVLSEKGHHLFASSMIEGATDFIFGQHASSWFEKCDIRVTAPGFITANGRDSANNPSFYVLNRCTVEGSPELNGRTYLGRPWRDHARVVFQNSRLGAVVNGDGWTQWSSQQPNTGNVYFGEFGNTGPGASGNRKFGRRLDYAVGIDTVLPNYRNWADGSYLQWVRKV